MNKNFHVIYTKLNKNGEKIGRVKQFDHLTSAIRFCEVRGHSWLSGNITELAFKSDNRFKFTFGDSYKYAIFTARVINLSEIIG